SDRKNSRGSGAHAGQGSDGNGDGSGARGPFTCGNDLFHDGRGKYQKADSRALGFVWVGCFLDGSGGGVSEIVHASESVWEFCAASGQVRARRESDLAG